MTDKPIKFEINAKKMTIEVSIARLIMPGIKVGSYLELGNVINPETREILNVTVLVTEDDGTAH